MTTSSKYIAWGAAIVGLITLSGGVYLFAKRNMDLALKYCYKIVSASNFSISKDRLKVILGVKVLNQSEIAANLLSYDFDIYLNNIRLGRVASDIKQRIEAKDSSVLSIAVDISSVGKITMSDVITIGLNYANKNNWNKIIIQIKGKLKASVKMLGVEIPLPVSLDIKMSLKEIMEDDPNATVCPKDF